MKDTAFSKANARDGWEVSATGDELEKSTNTLAN